MLRVASSSSSDDFHSVLAPLSLNTVLNRSHRLQRTSNSPKRRLGRTVRAIASSNSGHSAQPRSKSRPSSISTPIKTRSSTRNEWLQDAQSSPWACHLTSSPNVIPIGSRRSDKIIVHEGMLAGSSNGSSTNAMQHWPRQLLQANNDSVRRNASARRECNIDGAAEDADYLLDSSPCHRREKRALLIHPAEEQRQEQHLKVTLSSDQSSPLSSQASSDDSLADCNSPSTLSSPPSSSFHSEDFLDSDTGSTLTPITSDFDAFQYQLELTQRIKQEEEETLDLSDLACEMAKARSKSIESQQSPLANKRKGTGLSLSTSVVKKARKDGKSQKDSLIPEVVIDTSMSLWSQNGAHRSPKKRKPLQPIPSNISIYSVSDGDDSDFEIVSSTKSSSQEGCKKEVVMDMESTRVLASSSGILTPRRRNTLQKMTSLMEAIFEADAEVAAREDSNQQLSSEAQEIFRLQGQGHVARLRGKIATLLVRTVQRCSSQDVPDREIDQPNKWSDLDTKDLGRLIKIIHRGLEQEDGIDPFPRFTREEKSLPSSTSKSTRKSTSPRKRALVEEKEEEEDEDSLSENTLSKIQEKLRQIAYNLTLADGCLALTSKHDSSKELLCEEMLLPSIYPIKMALENVIVPFVNACSEITSNSNTLLNGFINTLAQQTAKGKECAEQLGKISRLLLSCLGQICKVLNQADLILSETMAFNLTTSLLPLFFVLDMEDKNQDNIKKIAIAFLGTGQTPLKTLRLSALQIIRCIYERKEEQRDFIISTILDGMQSLQDVQKKSRKQYKLSNGKTICSSSALLVQIIQASSNSIAKTRKVISDGAWEDEEMSEDDEVTHSDVYEMQKLREGQNLAVRAAEGVARCLMYKVSTKSNSNGSTKSPKGATSNPIDTGLASVVETLVSDLLEMLTCIEWPASSLLLSQLSKEFCACLDEEKASHDVRGIALEQLSFIAKSWYESEAQVRNTGDGLIKAQDIQVMRSREGLENLNAKYWQVINHLREASDDSTSSVCAARFMEAQWGLEMVAMLHKGVASIDKSELVHEDSEKSSDITAFIRHADTLIGKMVTAAFEAEGTMSKVVLQGGSTNMNMSACEVSRQIMHTFCYGVHFDSIRMQLVIASSGPNAGNRNKALRGLSPLCNLSRKDDRDGHQDEDILEAIKRCLYDESVHVRDSAIALLGKLTLDDMEQLQPRLSVLKEKLEDTGLLVRKRTLKLFKELYDASNDDNSRIDLAVEMTRCVFDEEESIKDLAVEFMAQVWFNFNPVSANKSPVKKDKRTPKKAKSKEMEEQEEAEWNEEEKEAIQTRLKILVQVADRLRVKPNPIQEILKLLSRRRDGNDLSRQIKYLVDVTVDDIVDIHKGMGISNVEQVAKEVEVIVLLVKTNPSTLSITKAKELLPYLRGGSGDAETRLLKGLLNIFNLCLPVMSSTAQSFAKSLQGILTPLCTKPAMHLPVLEELIKCFCIVVCHHTKDMDMLLKSLRVCYQQVQGMSGRVTRANTTGYRVLLMTLSYLVGNADFDLIRATDPIIATQIDTITKEPIVDQVVNLLVNLLNDEHLRLSALQALRVICRAHPRLLMTESIGKEVEAILTNGVTAERSLVLQMVSDVMAVESIKFDPIQQQDTSRRIGQAKRTEVKVVTRDELAGEAKSLANPVTFEIVARYGDLIQGLIRVLPLQRQLLDIMEVVIMRGICHPLQYLSSVIALQTVKTNRWVVDKAQSLHQHLISKTSSSINFGHSSHARDAWALQCHLEGKQVRGIFRSFSGGYEALFETWYSTIREMRKTRIKYFRSLIKAFDVDISSGKMEEDEVHYARFVADNLACLNYRLVEEVIFVLNELQNILASTAEQIQISVQEEVPVDGEEVGADEEDEEVQRGMIIGRMSTVMSIVLHLRAHLKILYGLSENQITKGAEKKASNAVVNRKREIGILMLDDIPGALDRKETSMVQARKEMNYFDTLFDSDKVGADEDDYDIDD